MSGAVRAGMDVYDHQGRYLGMVTRVYLAPRRALVKSAAAPRDDLFGCFKVRRGPFPFFGPPPYLVPFDAVLDSHDNRVTINAERGLGS